MSENDEIEIACEVKKTTGAAWLIFDGKRTEWVPLSMIRRWDNDKKGVVTAIYIPEWLANDKGFI